MKILPQNKTSIVIYASIILFLLYITIIHPMLDHLSQKIYYCDILKNRGSYEGAMSVFMKTWDKRLGNDIEIYQGACLGDYNASQKTISLIEDMERDEKIVQLEILKIIIDDNRTRKAALIKAEYFISQKVNDVNISNKHRDRAVDILLNDCNDKCIDEIFKTKHNLIFGESLEPCRIVQNDAKRQLKLNQLGEDKQNNHLDFLQTYCKHYL